MKKTLMALFLILSLILGGCVVVVETPPETAATVSGEGLTIHFIDVGQADSILLECDGKFMMVDGGKVGDGQLVISYLQQQGVEELEAVVCTHAHEDHVGGLPSVLAVFPTKAVYAPTNTYSSKVFDDFLYYTDQQRLEVTIPSPGDRLDLGQTKITVMGPVKSYAETNDTSIVLRVEYGENSFLLTGDMEVAAENDMLDYWEGRVDWRADVLKVGHHGSETSTGHRFLYEVEPEYGVISVGEGNSYGHPNEEPLSRLNDAGVALFRTDYLGTIIARTDGTEVSFTWENQSASPEDVEPAQPQVFIGNKNSKKFHGPDCGSLPKEENRVEFDSYNAAVEAGYSACSSCLG